MDELSVKCLLYADDQVILALLACELQEMLIKRSARPANGEGGRSSRRENDDGRFEVSAPAHAARRDPNVASGSFRGAAPAPLSFACRST
ncbi:hypothetical protein EVAR_44080_1 [Eumeta japonica]|uniref:Uncharacterized protein n=1 Tax=Eumeta variegata TaxID=151549 RepID=A0A4C1X273_EUMVA|nr:hypothetical protein EVAR_44080_1 [Eumeta japonica]